MPLVKPKPKSKDRRPRRGASPQRLRAAARRLRDVVKPALGKLAGQLAGEKDLELVVMAFNCRADELLRAIDRRARGDDDGPTNAVLPPPSENGGPRP